MRERGIGQQSRLVNTDILTAMVYNNDMVSVILPVFNAEKYILTTLNSVLSQNYSNMEVLVVDDFSSDKTKDIVNSVSDHRIIYHKLPENQGAAVARNKALELAQGRYVAFIDSDDIWLTGKIECQLAQMQSENAAISFTAIDYIDENGNTIKGKRPVKELIDYNFLLHNTMIATTVIIDRNITGNFQMPLRRSGQDYATWLMLMRNGTQAHGINEVYTHYRISNNSLSSNKLKSIQQVWDIQINDEKISKLKAAVNVCGFVWNALKKRKM